MTTPTDTPARDRIAALVLDLEALAADLGEHRGELTRITDELARVLAL